MADESLQTAEQPAQPVAAAPATADSLEARTVRMTSNGAWTWYSDPRVLQTSRYTYFAYVTRAGVRHELGDRDGALADVAVGLDLAPGSAELHCLDGVLLLDAGEVVAALAAFVAAIAADPALVAAWANRAVARFETGDALGAISDLDAAIALDDDPDLRANREVVLESLAA